MNSSFQSIEAKLVLLDGRVRFVEHRLSNDHPNANSVNTVPSAIALVSRDRDENDIVAVGSLDGPIHSDSILT